LRVWLKVLKVRVPFQVFREAFNGVPDRSGGERGARVGAVDGEIMQHCVSFGGFKEQQNDFMHGLVSIQRRIAWGA
jgi:hypothetical protein